MNHGRSCIPSDEQTQTRKKRKLSTKENYCSENIDNASIPERLERGFLITDIESYQENIMASGSTALVCLVTKEKESDESDNENIVIYAAGVGDTRCVLSCLPQADKNVSKSSPLVQRLSTDHRASDPKEQQRVDSSGGFVFKNRVLGILSVSRSLGECFLWTCTFLIPFYINIFLRTSSHKHHNFFISLISFVMMFNRRQQTETIRDRKTRRYSHKIESRSNSNKNIQSSRKENFTDENENKNYH